MTGRFCSLVVAISIWASCWTPAPANAAQTEIGSCYQAVKLEGVSVPTLQRELFVIVDQTVVLDESLQEQAFQKIMKFLSPGDRIVVMGFSAYVADRYTEVLFDGLLDPRLTDEQRYDVPKKTLRVLDSCYQTQEKAVRQFAGKSLIKIFQNSSSKLPNTELIGNLALLGKHFTVSSHAGRRYVLIVSDMLEHSKLTSFYKGGKLRMIDPAAELGRAREAGFVSDLGGASIYVIGGGYSLTGAYRAATEVNALEAFWQQYFSASNAKLRGFGMPSLIGEIGE